MSLKPRGLHPSPPLPSDSSSTSDSTSAHFLFLTHAFSYFPRGFCFDTRSPWMAQTNFRSLQTIVLYHSGSGRIFLVFGQDPSHSDGTFVSYMRYDPPCTATRPISFASDHLNCLRPNRTEPSRAMHHRIFSRQTVNYHACHDLDSALRLLLLWRQGSRSLWKGRQ